MQDCAELNSIAEGEIAALRLDGITPTDADVVLINALCWAVQSPRIRMELAKGRPVQCGNRWLWPLTLCAEEWFRREGADCPDPRGALAYAMSRAHDESLSVATYADAKAWIKGTLATSDQLLEATAQVVSQERGPDMPPSDDANGLTAGELSAALLATAGGTADMWERQCSIGACKATLDVLAAQQRADGKSIFQSAKIKATIALGWAVERIRQRELNKGDPSNV
jgi:hypothetical protein